MSGARAHGYLALAFVGAAAASAVALYLLKRPKAETKAKAARAPWLSVSELCDVLDDILKMSQQCVQEAKMMEMQIMQQGAPKEEAKHHSKALFKQRLEEVDAAVFREHKTTERQVSKASAYYADHADVAPRLAELDAKLDTILEPMAQIPPDMTEARFVGVVEGLLGEQQVLIKAAMEDAYAAEKAAPAGAGPRMTLAERMSQTLATSTEEAKHAYLRREGLNEPQFVACCEKFGHHPRIQLAFQNHQRLIQSVMRQ